MFNLIDKVRILKQLMYLHHGMTKQGLIVKRRILKISGQMKQNLFQYMILNMPKNTIFSNIHLNGLLI